MGCATVACALLLALAAPAQVDELRQLEAERARLLIRFTERHPDVVLISKRIEALREQVDAARQPEADVHRHDEAGRATASAAASGARPRARRGAALPPGAMACADDQPSTANLEVRPSQLRQRMDGFGATHVTHTHSWGYDRSVLATPDRNTLTAAQLERVTRLIFDEIGVNLGPVPPIREAGFDGRPGNDNADPRTMLPGSPNRERFDGFFDSLVAASPKGVADLYPNADIDRRAAPWLMALKGQDYELFLDESAELALLNVRAWQERTGSAPRLLQLFNEPLHGRNFTGTRGDLVNVTRRVGRRLREAGFAETRLLVPNDSTPEFAADEAEELVADPEAREYIGAIGYHSYPYGSGYAYLPRMLATRERGAFDQDEIHQRERLRELSSRTGIPVWMTEVSNGFSAGGPRRTPTPQSGDSMTWLRGRAVHIHDELRFAGASAYFAMLNVWDAVADREHFRTGGGVENMMRQGDHLVLVDNDRDEVIVTAMGYAIGHYARWVKPGARYASSESTDPRVLISAFVDGASVTAVLVNNTGESRCAALMILGHVSASSITGERSDEGGYWAPFELDGSMPLPLRLQLSPYSVTSLSLSGEVFAP